LLRIVANYSTMSISNVISKVLQQISQLIIFVVFMGGARNLILKGEADGGKGQSTGGGQYIVLCVGQMSTLFSCCLHEKRCSGVLGQSPWSGDQGAKPPPLKLKHFCFLDV